MTTSNDDDAAFKRNQGQGFTGARSSRRRGQAKAILFQPIVVILIICKQWPKIGLLNSDPFVSEQNQHLSRSLTQSLTDHTHSLAHSLTQTHSLTETHRLTVHESLESTKSHSLTVTGHLRTFTRLDRPCMLPISQFHHHRDSEPRLQ